MKTIYTRFGQIAAQRCWASCLLQAVGDGCRLQHYPEDSGGAIQTCATGGFSFTKTTVGTFPASGPSVTLDGSAAVPCFGADQNRTLSAGALSVTVANVTLNGQDEGPNVVSIAGSLSSGNGSNHYTISFAADKTFTVTQNTGQNPVVRSGGLLCLQRGECRAGAGKSVACPGRPERACPVPSSAPPRINSTACCRSGISCYPRPASATGIAFCLPLNRWTASP